MKYISLRVLAGHVIAAASVLLGLGSGNLNAQSCTPSPSGIVSWWRAEGDATDVTGGNDGNGSYGFATGEVGQAFSLDGATTYIDLGNPSNLQLQNFTIEAWIKRYSSSTTSYATPDAEIFCYGQGGYGFGIWNTGNLFLTAWGVNNLQVSTGLTDTNNFHHVAVTKSGSSVIFYLDGVAFPASSYSTAFVFNTDVAIGAQGGDDGNNFFGEIDELAVYSNILSQAQIQAIYNAGPAGKCISGVPEFTLQPTNATIGVGLNDTLVAAATGSPPLTCQWSFNGANLSRATNFSLILTNLQTTNGGTYSVLVSNQYGTASASASLTVEIVPPRIVTQPASSETANVGGLASFSVTAAGSLPLSYQWWFNSGVVPGATNNTISLTNLQLNQAGNYFVVVSNGGGTISSSEGYLTVNPPPPCVAAPSNLVSWWPAEGNAGDAYGGNNGIISNMTFGAGEVDRAFNGNGSNSFVNLGSPLSLELQNFTIEAWVRRYNSNSTSLTSSDAMFFCWGNGGYGFGIWNYGGIFLTQADINNIVASVNLTDTNNFHHVAVTKSGTTVIFYLDGVAYPYGSSYTSTFTFTTPLAIGADGDDHLAPFYGAIDELSVYSRALSATEIQSIYSAGAGGKCQQSIPPTIYLQPTNQTIFPNNTITLAVGATGSPAMSYQWLENGTNLPGATNNFLTISNIQAANAGNYSIFIANSSGSVTSSVATINVVLVTVYGNGSKLTNSLYSYSGSVAITLTNFYTGGYIFYTLDGSTPTPFSTVYSGPIMLSNNAVIRTLAFSVDFTQYAYSTPLTVQVVPGYTLTTGTPGGGTITRSPTNAALLSNTVVTLTATPASGWTFLQWQGDTSGTTATNTFVMTRNKSVQAVFGTTVTNSVGGSGSVVFDPPGPIFPYGYALQASAIPQAGNVFVLWGNAASGSTNPLSFLVTNANPEISALFTTAGSGQVALAVIPTGHGSVTVNPRANSYASGSSVTLTATPNSGKSFLGWSGNASGTQNPLTVVMNQSKVIYANFSTNYSLTIATVPAGINQGVELSLSGELGTHYRLDTSTDMVNWTALFNLTNAVGTLYYLDTNTTNMGEKFYRSIILP